MAMNRDSQKPKCPPAFVRLTPQSPCVPKGFVTPFGGPASGISPSGSSLSGASGASRQNCRNANIFASCFLECNGQISQASPGPVCGWTFSTAFGTSTEPILLGPGHLTIQTSTNTDYIGATHPLSRPLASLFEMSGQFEFTEYQTPPNAFTTYQLFVNNIDLSQGFLVSLAGDGTGALQIGDPANSPTYIFLWTPNFGSHVVHFSIDSLGKPRLYIDHVEVTLTFTGNVPTFGGLPANILGFFGGSAENGAASSTVRNVFLTAGNVGPETIFCCPAA